ncbi:MAG: hypothetical protein L0H93_05440 [Nocardioides sp.]|nr:hypothetical protein [Nocardioides sp.]
MRLVSIVIAALVVLGLVAPAQADTGRIRDRVDTRSAQSDIRSVQINNARHRIVLTVKFRALRPRKRANVTILVDPRPRDRVQFLAFAMRSARGKTRANLLRATNLEFGGRPITCRGYTARWQLRRNRIRIVLPQRCLHHNGPLHNFKAIAGFWDGRHGDYTAMKSVRRG